MKDTKTRIVPFGKHRIGDGDLFIIGGPCSVESEEQFRLTAQSVKEVQGHALRGGLFKMRTRPDTFQGLGPEAFDFVAKVKGDLNLPFVSEVVDPRHIGPLMEVVDAFQVGSRNMYNYALLKELALTQKPVLLKRGFSATLDEWLNAAEYLAAGGNENIVLCERGIRSFEDKYRNTMDLNAVVYLKQNAPWPVLVDPSHGTGVASMVPAMAYAGVAAGADGLIVEMHPNPKEALSDGYQALLPEEFKNMVNTARSIHKALQQGRQEETQRLSKTS